MRTLQLFALFVVLGFATGCKGAAPLPPKAIELNRAGVEALEQGDLETADARFALALEYNPRFVEALVNQGLVELQRGNFRRARQLLGRALRLNPDVAQPHHGLGVLAEREQRPDVAAKHYEDALKVDPGFAASRANLARLLFEAGRFEHARVQFKRLTEVAPDDASGHVGLVETLLQLDRRSEADAALARARGRFPEDEKLQILEARRQMRLGRFDSAVALLTPLARARDEIAVRALGFLGTAELARSRPRFAVGAAERALALDPEDPVGVFVMAAALSALSDPGAPAWVARADRLAPGARKNIEGLAAR
ncbi:MAG: tetratricopeptide repeat protein [Polyangiaceae bacterium]